MILRPQTALAGGRYIVQHHLDSGAMADVYLATDTQRAVSVALKVMRAELSLDEYFETYFQREASVLQQLQHPNIVRLYELVRDGNLLFLVMDYITGPTLQQHLFTKKLLPTSDAILIARSLATALDFAHSKGVIHRDLKPSNVLLADHGAILLSDFGVARVAGSVTTAASRMGTLAYMSPEQITGGELTPAADQYSLGILLWELLTGRRPFVGETPGLAAGPLGERVMEEHLKYPPPTGVLPADMFPVLVRTLAKHARQRFPTCLDMVNQLITNTGVQPTSAKLWNRKIDDFDSAPTQPPPIALPKPGVGVIAAPEKSSAPKPDLNLDAAARSTPRKVTQPNIGETKAAVANDVRTRRFVQTRRYGDSSYTGELKDDKRNGQGTLTFPDGETYSGTWKDDKYNGQGTLTFADGNTYTGEFRDGKYNGQGTLTFADGTTYTGEFKDDKRNGSGTFTYADGRKSTGEFLDGMPKDHRTYTYADAGVIAAPVKSDVHKTNLHLDAAQRSASQNLTQQNSGETKDAGASGVRTTRFVQAKRYGDSSYTGEFREGNPTGQGTVLTPKVVEIPTPEKSGADKTVKLDDRPKIDRATARQAWHDAVKKEGVHRATIREIEMQITAHKNKVHFKCRAVYLNNQALDRGNVEVGNELLRYYGWSGGINVELGLIKSFTSGSSNLSPRSGVPLLQRLHPKVIRQGDTLLITVRQFHTKPKQVVLADLPNGSKLQQEIEVRIEKLAEAKHQLTELELQKTAAKATLAEATLNQERAFRFLTTGKD